MAKAADRYLVVDPWKIIEDGYHPARSRVSESVFSLANEHLGVRGYFDEGYSGDSLVGCYFNGVYEERYLREPLGYRGIPGRIRFMVNAVDWLHTCIELDGEALDLGRCQFSDFRRELDLRTGELRRQFAWQTESGKQLKLVFSRFLSMNTKELGFQRITLEPLNFSGPISITLGMDFTTVHECYEENYWICPRKSVQDSTYAILGVSKNTKHKLFAGFTVLTDAPERHGVEGDQFAGCAFSLNLVEGRESSIDKLSVMYTTRDPEDTVEETWSQGMGLVDTHRQTGHRQAYQSNVEYWKSLWDRCDVVIDGDPAAQQGIRFCIFQLQQTYRGIIDGANIGGKGLTGEAYNGNAFWDTESFCLSYYLFNNPDAAKNLVNFRYRTLAQALDRAKQLDCVGACFPVATIDGTESCTLWQHANLQLQTTTAVAYAIWHYVQVTQDFDFLYAKGVELLIHICRFLASRGQWSSHKDKFGYYGVMGPDEFHMMVNHNAYTNFMAKQTFEYTWGVLADMESTSPKKRKAVCKALSCGTAELAAWREMAEGMFIPYEPQTGIYEQHEGFFDLPHIDVDTIPTEDFPLYYHWSYDRIYRYDMIKQPDVLMLMLLYNQSFSQAEKRANYDYYSPRCIHESSLSPSVHSILAAELGNHQEAVELFEFATRIDLDNYNRNTAEGIHITSIAGAWMNVVYGFGGLRSDGDMLLFDPTIPERWTSYRCQIVYRGSLIRLTVTQKEARIQVVEGPPVRLAIRGEAREIDKDGWSFEL